MLLAETFPRSWTMFVSCDVLEVRRLKSRTHRILIKVRFRVANGARSAFNHKASGMNNPLCPHVS